MIFDLTLALARWLNRRWWGKPSAWLIYGVIYLVLGVCLAVLAVLAVAIVGGIVGGIGYALVTSNPVSSSLFVAAVILAAIAVVLFDRMQETGALGVGGVAAVLTIAWIVSIPSGDGGGSGCEPSYPDACLKSNASDYDCSGGTGDGPRYVSGPIEVSGGDPFGLDSDGDGVGCE